MPLVEVGKKAPAFSLKDQSGSVRLFLLSLPPALWQQGDEVECGKVLQLVWCLAISQ